MKKNQTIFILCLTASLLVTFLTVHSLCSQTLHLAFPQLTRQDTLRMLNDTLTKSQTSYHTELRAVKQNNLSRNDTLRIIGDAVNKGIFYKENYSVQLKISEKLYNDFEFLYRENRLYMRLLDSLGHTADCNINYLPTAIITTGIVSVIWSLIFIFLK